MPYVETVPVEKAGPELAGLYEKVTKTFGFVPNYSQAQAAYRI